MPERWLMKIVAIGPAILDKPQWLRAYDVDAHDGLGSTVLTTNQRTALAFDSLASVMKAWQTQSMKRPLRDDGKPNRPLTAYSISPERVPE